MWNTLLFLKIVLGLCVAFELKCPEPAQWSIRSKLLCQNPALYYCLLSINGSSKIYTESCSRVDFGAPGSRVDFEAPGKRIVIRGNIDSQSCSNDKYQPIKYWTNVSSDCLYLTSKCSVEGQMLYRSDPYRENDDYCRCEYTKGFDFVTKPKRAIFCIPSQEDCSCYKKNCSITSILSQDYQCLEEIPKSVPDVFTVSIMTRVETSKVILPSLNKINETDLDAKGSKEKTNAFVVVLMALIILICMFMALLCCGIEMDIIMDQTCRKVFFITELEKKVILTEGENLTLMCSISRKNTPVKWTKNGQELLQTAYTSCGYIHQMTIHNLKLGDEGRYGVHIKDKSSYSHIIVKEIPEVIRRLSEKDKELYLEIIKSGTETRYYIRIIIIGENGVGKTCLLHRLLRETIDDVKSTDGVDIVHRCKIRLRDGMWIIDGVSDKRKAIVSRIRQAVNSKSSNEKLDSHSIIEITTSENERGQEKLNSFNSKPTTSENQETWKRQRNILESNENKVLTSKNISDDIEVQAPFSYDNEFTTEDTIGRKQEGDNYIKLTLEKILTEIDLNELSKVVNDIVKFDIPDEVLVDCGFWDFAGQRHYYPTHPIFLNSNAVHLLVANVEKDIKEINPEGGFQEIGEYVDFWFDSVHSCMEDKTENSKEYLHPPVIFVGTGIDSCKNNLQERKEEFCRQLTTTLDKQDKGKHLRDIYWVSNTESPDTDFYGLRQSIFNLGKELKTFGVRLPLRWIQLEQLLDIIREADINILSWVDFTQLSSKCSIDDEKEITLFLKYHHRIGTIIYFECLKENIILNQTWLAKAFRCLVSDKYDDNIMLTPEWRTLKDTGKLELVLIKNLFQKEPQLEFDKNQRHLLKVMELFGVIIKPKTLLEDGQKQTSSSYYMPCMISKVAVIGEIHDLFKVKSDECKCTPWLCIQFDFMPLDFFNHIFCYYISKYPICTDPSTNQKAIYHGMGVFYLDKNKLQKLIVCFSKNTISIQLWQWKMIEHSKYKAIMDELMLVIQKVMDKYEPRRVSYIIKLKCSYGSLHKPDGRLSYKELAELQADEYFCEEHNILHNTSDFFQSWFAHYSESKIKEYVHTINTALVLTPFTERKVSRNKSEVLPEIIVRTLDGKIRHIQEKEITIDGDSKLDRQSNEKRREVSLASIPASKADESANKCRTLSEVNINDIQSIKMTESDWKALCQMEARKGKEITLEELPMACAPDSILLLDISGSLVGYGYQDMKAAAYDFMNKRSATREETALNENIAMVTFGHKTEVRHHLTCDYSVVEKHLERLPEPGGPSSLVVGLQLCQSVIDARGKVSMIGGKRVRRKVVGGSRFHPRIILISDGNLTPSECVVGNKSLPDINTMDEKEMNLMIEKLLNICRELRNSKVQIVCIPVGCYDKDRLQFIADMTGGKMIEKKRAASLGNERLKMVYAKEIEEGKITVDTFKSKLLAMKAITAADFDEIIDMAKNPAKYGVDDDLEDNSDNEDTDFLHLLENVAPFADYLFEDSDEDSVDENTHFF